jgi:alkanesulfonate monooxygenase SsuD/methylene tetrahydromethanopterin reductase-like flavin-dependent oxidoreductase (luciferase family)
LSSLHIGVKPSSAAQEEKEDDVATQLKVGVLGFPQYTDWASLQGLGKTVDDLGYDSLWTWDHLYPIVGDPRGPIFEGYMTLAGWAAVTRKVTLGLMVGANPFRNPALVVKMVTTLDHMSAGRAILGIGGAWFETEHKAMGINFGSGFGERLDWLDEAVELMRGMLHEAETTARGRFYHATNARNDPPPVQKNLPILIGGDGEKKTLHTVAKYADAWNTGGDIEFVRHKDAVLRRWCEEVGRDESEIERTLGLGQLVIRDDPAEARRVAEEIRRRNGNHEDNIRMTGAEELAESLIPFAELGFRHILFDAPQPHDRETLERFIGEVKPMVEAKALH